MAFSNSPSSPVSFHAFHYLGFIANRHKFFHPVPRALNDFNAIFIPSANLLPSALSTFHVMISDTKTSPRIFAKMELFVHFVPLWCWCVLLLDGKRQMAKVLLCNPQFVCTLYHCWKITKCNMLLNQIDGNAKRQRPRISTAEMCFRQ